VGEQQSSENVVLDPVSFPSQRELLGALTEIPMQGMKILVGLSPKQSSISPNRVAKFNVTSLLWTPPALEMSLMPAFLP